MSNNDSPLPPEQRRLQAAGVRTLLNFAFQPYVDTALRRVVGHEALLRGPAGEPARQMLAQVALDNRHAFDLDCRNDAVRSGARLGLDRGEQALNINLLPNALGEGGRTLLSTFAVAAAEGLPTSRLVLEVTECERVSDPASLRDLFADFREFAFRTALDDLLAGWANLKLLAEFRPHFVKLDLALVERIDEDSRRQAVVRGLKQACDDLGCEIIAEGVEREPESHCLSDLGIFLQQGYLFARPALDSLVNDPHFPAPTGDPGPNS